MNNRHFLTIASIIASSVVVFHVARAQADAAGDEGADESGELDDYWAYVVANDAAAEGWRPVHAKGGHAELSDDEQLVDSNYGCPQGTQFWQRDRVTDIRARLCDLVEAIRTNPAPSPTSRSKA